MRQAVGLKDYATVEDLRARVTTPQDNDKVFVLENNSLYDWRPTNTSPDDGDTIIAQSNAGGGRWVKIGKISKHTHIVATTSYDPLNPLNGWTAPTNPIQGNTVEVKFTDGTVGNYTFDGTAWELDFENQWFEKRICLNTATPAFTPLDVNNPLTSEVQAWITSNLTLIDLVNGTQLVYFVPGDEGSEFEPDYIWTLNNEEATLSNKRVFNTKTVYVDAGSGSDITGRRGYREFPFKTIEAAYAVLQDKDVLHFLPGEYTTNANYFRVGETLNIHLETGATLIKTGSSNNLFGLSARNSNYSALTGNLNITGNGVIKNQTTGLLDVTRYPHNSDVKVELGELWLEAGSNQAWGVTHTARNQSVYIKTAYLNNNKILGAVLQFLHIDSPITNDELPFNSVFKCDNILVSNQSTRGAIYRIQGYKIPKNSTATVEIGSVVFDNTCSSLASTLMMQANGSQPLQDCTIDVKINNIINQRTGVTPYTNYENSSNNTKSGEFGFGGAQSPAQPYTNANCTFYSENIYTTGDIIAFRGIVFSQSNINLNIKNGVSLNCAAMTFADPHLSNNTVATFDCNLETKANNPCAILYYPGIDSTSKAVLKGSYKTSAAGTATIQIAAGSASGRLYLEDCTLINDGTVANITTNSSTPITIVCKNVFMNSTINDPNINLVGTYFQNAIYN
jgi:hypothetical protein